MQARKCCAHCPGKYTPPGSRESHDCCQPKYVTGNLRISSLERHVPGCSARKKQSTAGPSPENRSCYDKFAFARRLHAENLEHQPLPDKVEDSVFKNMAPRTSCRRIPGKCECPKHRDEPDYVRKMNRHYGTELGCKKPKTRMDLAICWETPIDPMYESRRPTHIDGSEGGLAPAIFSLVQHTTHSRAALRSGAIEMKNGDDKDRYKGEDSNKNLENGEEDRNSVKNRSCCDCLCKDLSDVNISKDIQEPRREKFRKCAACDSTNLRDDPRLIKSAVGLALGMEKDKAENRRHGSQSKTTVPRPRTPFARRSFGIDTLSPPFSVVDGRRDADYPEHWRLMSVYQQSYKNPQKRKSIYRY